MAHKRGFGQIRRLPSKRFQAGYTGPDGVLHYALSTFETALDSEAWLTDERRLIASGAWVSPTARLAKAQSEAPKSFATYAESWLRRRELKPRTRAHYATLLREHISPRFAEVPLASITPSDVVEWHHDLAAITGPTYRAHAYALLRTIMRTAVAEDEILVSPCRIRGAGNSKRVKQIEPATLGQLEALALAMPTRLRAMVLLAAWCALRFGELTELRRKDVDLKDAVLRIRRGVVRADGQVIVGTPKSDAGTRDVAIPPHLLPVLRVHVAEHAAQGRDGLMFPGPDGGNLAPSSFAWHFNKARDAAGRPDLRPHDLRHTGAVLAAQTGATLAELMARLGHSTPAAALRYQHAAQGRDAAIAAALSAIARGEVGRG